MSTTTKNFSLFKPELTDAADITKMNSNWDTIDEQLQKIKDEASADSVIEQNKSNEQKFWVGTKAEYDAIETKDPNTSYIITDDSDDTSCLPLSGGAMTGMLKTNGLMLTSGVDYGDSLPSAGQAGRIFFKKVSN